MVKKIASAVVLQSKQIAKKFKKTSRIVYFANPKSHIPHDIVMPASSFYKKIEQHLRNEITIIPVIDRPITWKVFVKYNPGFRRLRIDIIQAEGRDFPEKAWDRVAKNIVKILRSQHEWYKMV